MDTFVNTVWSWILMTYRSSNVTGIFLKTGNLYEHNQLNYVHMSVPKHSYQNDNAFMSLVVLYKWLTCIVIQSAVSKGVNKY